MERKFVKNIKRIIIKIGTNTILDENKNFCFKRAENWIESIYKLKKENYEFAIVSSGAIGLGANKLKFKLDTLSKKQLASSIGQPILISNYKKILKKYDLICSQTLLGNDDFKDPIRKNNLLNMWAESYLHGKIIKIINENDSVNTDEIKFGDNDNLSSIVANEMQADLLIILSNVEGLYKNIKNKEVIDYVSNLNDVKKYIKEEISENGTGGMQSKLEAANNFKGLTIIVSGFEKNIINKILSGEKIGTLFNLKKKKISTNGVRI